MSSCMDFGAQLPTQRFLVMQLARFGDVIQTKRLIQSLKAQGQVELLVDNSLISLAKLVYPDLLIHGLPAHGTHGPLCLTQLKNDLEVVAQKNYTQVYNLNFSGINFALSTMFSAQSVRGYKLEHGQRQIDFWPEQLMRWTKMRAQAGLNLVDAWGLYADQAMDPALINPVATPKGGGLGVVMAGQNARRSLPPKVLAPLVLAARNRLDHGPIYLLGAGHESRAAKEVAHLLPAALRSEVRDLVGKTSWPELFSVVGNLDLLLSPDTGTMHLAAHLGVPTLAFFLSSAWCHETGPYGQGHLVLQAISDCAPCLEQSPCPHDVLCCNVFSTPQVLAFVSGREDKELPSGITAMVSGFDALGLTYTARSGHDPDHEQRLAFRALAMGVAHLGFTGPVDQRLAQTLFYERDWMLPQQRSWRHE